MVNLLTRRAMILPSSSSEWDYEWNYQMGQPTDYIFNESKSGTVSSIIKSNGLRLSLSSGSSRYLQYYNSDLLNAQVGVIEANMMVKHRTSNAAGYGQLCFGNGTDGIFVLFSAESGYSGKIFLWDSSVGSRTVLGTFNNAVYKKVRIELVNGVGAVYLDDLLVKNNIQSSTNLWSADTKFGAQNFKEAEPNHYAQFEWVKIKVGRL